MIRPKTYYNEKEIFAAKLISPRSTFPADITDDERIIMRYHAAYLNRFLDKGQVVVYGPVFDPAGAYGIGIFCVHTEDELKAILAHDPALQIGRYEYYPMMAVLSDSK